ncbi:MAG: flagellar hook-associated protein FlgL [Planctomycetota bacterium]
MSTLPIPSTRVSDYLVRERLVQQSQSDQLEIFRLQNQISTGRRIFQPSEDGPAALRAITLQRSIERNDQLQTNLLSAKSTLGEADTALRGVANRINETRALAIGSSGSVQTDEERQTIRTGVLASLDQLVTFANSRSQESYLFAGSRALSAPYVQRDGYVEYLGNEVTQQQRVDTGVLFDVNVPGDEAFGGLSEPVRGSVDLNPHTTADTLLSSLDGGAGVVVDGSIEIAYFAHSSVVEAETATIDLSGAKTLGDVARLIEENGPPSANLRASVGPTGLIIETEPGSATPGSIAIREVAGGATARRLGIAEETQTTQVTGEDLNPALRLTTPLADLLGTKSAARLQLPGEGNDLILTATANGDGFDGTLVSFVGGATVGNESAVFTPGTPPTLVVTIADGQSTATGVAAAINNIAGQPFEAEIDYRDVSNVGASGSGVVTASLTPVGTTDTAGSGQTLDLASGLLVTNGGDPFVIDTSSAETVEDLLNLLNNPDNGLLASINSSGSGIDIRTRRSGADFSIGENGGTLATELGVRTYTGASRLEDFNRGSGVLIDGETPEEFAALNSFQITLLDRGTSTVFNIDLAGAVSPEGQTSGVETVDEVIAAIAAQTGGALTAELAATGNGIVLRRADDVDPALPATGTFNLANGSFDITTTQLGDAANDPDINVVVVDGTDTGAIYDADAGTITVTLDITNDVPNLNLNTQVANVAAAIDALPEFSVSNVVSTGAAVAETTVGGALTGGYDTDSILITGNAAQRLGFFDDDQSGRLSNNTSVTSSDVNTIEVDSVFNSLIRLADALDRGAEGVPDVGEAINRLDVDLDRATNARGELGARVNTLDNLKIRLEDEEVQLRSSLSLEIDVDLTEAISDFTARQFSLQASLQSTASILQLSLLDYL